MSGPLGERVSRSGAFSSRSVTGLCSPKGYELPGHTTTYGPLSAEGLVPPSAELPSPRQLEPMASIRVRLREVRILRGGT